MSAPQITLVFESFWRFAAERHRIYEKRLRGEPRPWTDDPILAQYKFTNVFRAADRVSQYLIKVIYHPDASTDAEEVVFRTLLFKLFNSIPCWEILMKNVWYSDLEGIQRSGLRAGLRRRQGRRSQHLEHGVCAESKLRHALADQTRTVLGVGRAHDAEWHHRKAPKAKTYRDAFFVLQSYPLHGKSFLPMQHLTDLNYSEVIDFDEDDFIVPGARCSRRHGKVLRRSSEPIVGRADN